MEGGGETWENTDIQRMSRDEGLYSWVMVTISECLNHWCVGQWNETTRSENLTMSSVETIIRLFAGRNVVFREVTNHMAEMTCWLLRMRTVWGEWPSRTSWHRYLLCQPVWHPTRTEIFLKLAGILSVDSPNRWSKHIRGMRSRPVIFTQLFNSLSHTHLTFILDWLGGTK